MAFRRTHLEVLRRERHPLVALATLAFSLRLCLVILATGASPDFAAASGLTSLCQTSPHEQSTPWSHDMPACQCGPACAHGCASGSHLACISSALPSAVQGSQASADGADLPLFSTDKGRVTSIRGPPQFLI